MHRYQKGRDRIEILPGKVKPGVVKTYSDHRMAMAFALIGLKVDGIIIDDYECCAKHLRIILRYLKLQQESRESCLIKFKFIFDFILFIG